MLNRHAQNCSGKKVVQGLHAIFPSQPNRESFGSALVSSHELPAIPWDGEGTSLRWTLRDTEAAGLRAQRAIKC